MGHAIRPKLLAPSLPTTISIHQSGSVGWLSQGVRYRTNPIIHLYTVNRDKNFNVAIF